MVTAETQSTYKASHSQTKLNTVMLTHCCTTSVHTLHLWVWQHDHLAILLMGVWGYTIHCLLLLLHSVHNTEGEHVLELDRKL